MPAIGKLLYTANTRARGSISISFLLLALSEMSYTHKIPLQIIIAQDSNSSEITRNSYLPVYKWCRSCGDPRLGELESGVRLRYNA